MPKVPKDAEVHRTVTPLIREETSLPIYWLNAEWAVNEFGMESLCHGSWYAIPASDLGRARGDRAEWPAQIEDKGWTDPRLFLEAFLKALEIHSTAHNFDLEREWALANRAADELVIEREMSRRRRQASPHALDYIDVREMDEMDKQLEEVRSEGFRAPDFPESCVPPEAD